MDKLVSVLMCVYNTPVEYLQEAVCSILQQSYSNLEYIIVDDRSEHKETVDYLNRVSEEDDRIKLFRNSVNMGLTRSLNVGLQQCNGAYIARMDADDVSLPDRLEMQVRFMKTHPDAALVGGSIACFGKGTEGIDSIVQYSVGDYDRYRIRTLIQHPGPAHPTFMFRAQFLRDNGIIYNEAIRKGQDYNIITRILGAGGRIAIVEDVLLKYRIHAEQITATSEYEQLLYQSRTSYEYVKTVFPILKDEECAALSTLGWYEDHKVMDEALKTCNRSETVCEHLIRNRKALEKPHVYVSAIKKVLRITGREIYMIRLSLKRNWKINGGKRL